MIKHLDSNVIILFGSFARGDTNEGSDVDIMVVADFEQEFLDRIKVLLDLDVGLPLEPVGYTPEEFTRMQMEGNPFILDVLEKGKILYERPRGW